MVSTIDNLKARAGCTIGRLYGDGELGGLMQAILVGNKSELSKDRKSLFASLGVVHVLAVSGLHLGLIFILFNTLFSPLKKLKFGWAIYSVLILFFIWAYALLTGFSDSVQRAALMVSVFVIGNALQRSYSTINALVFSFIVLLVLDPAMLSHPGFQLSFLAIAGIVWIAQPLMGALEFSSPLIKRIWQAACVSVGAHISTFPLVLFYFGSHANLFLISNLLMVPLFVALLYAGNFTLLCGLFAYDLPDFLVNLQSRIYDLIVFISTALDAVPFSSFQGVSISLFQTVMLYLLMGLFLLAFNRRSKGILIYAFVILLVEGLII